MNLNKRSDILKTLIKFNSIMRILCAFLELKTVVATVKQATLQGLNPFSLPRRQRPPLDRRTRDKRAEAEWGRRLTDRGKGPGQIPHSVLIGQIWVTLPVWNAIENSCFGPPLLCYLAVAGLRWAHSEVPCRNGVEYQEKRRRRAARKRSSEVARLTITVRPRPVCFLAHGVTVGTGVSRRVCVFVCVGTREVCGTH